MYEKVKDALEKASEIADAISTAKDQFENSEDETDNDALAAISAYDEILSMNPDSMTPADMTRVLA